MTDCTCACTLITSAYLYQWTINRSSNRRVTRNLWWLSVTSYKGHTIQNISISIKFCRRIRWHLAGQRRGMVMYTACPLNTPPHQWFHLIRRTNIDDTLIKREREGERDVTGIAHQSSTKECILTIREAVPWTRNRFYRSGEVMVADRTRCHTCPREVAMAVRFTC